MRYFCFPHRPSSENHKPGGAENLVQSCQLNEVRLKSLAPTHTPVTVLCWPAETSPAKSLHAGLSDEDVVGAFLHARWALTSGSKPPLGTLRPPSNSVDLRSHRHGLQTEGRERSAGSAATRSGMDLRSVESLSGSRYPLSLVQLNDWTVR